MNKEGIEKGRADGIEEERQVATREKLRRQ